MYCSRLMKTVLILTVRIWSLILAVPCGNSLFRSVSTVTAARANASSVFQLFFFLAFCSGMISKGFSFVAFYASVESQFRMYSSVLSSMPVIRSSRRM